MKSAETKVAPQKRVQNFFILHSSFFLSESGGMPWTRTTPPFQGAHCLANRSGSLVRLTFQIGRRGETCTPKAVRS